jgi:hypothetical protein
MGISFGTFAWWKHQLAGTPCGRAGIGRRASTPPRFVRVEVLPPGVPVSDEPRPVISAEVTGASLPAGSVPLEIVLPGDIRLRVGRDCDVALLDRVLATLRGSGC